MKGMEVFDTISFIEETHRYYHDKKTGASTTGVIKEYQEPFDSEYWTVYKALQACGYKVRKAKNRKMYVSDNLLALSACKRLLKGKTHTAEGFRKLWDQMAEDGKARGTRIHKQIEQAWHERMDGRKRLLDIWQGKAALSDDPASQFVRDHPHFVPVAIEQPVCDFEYMIFGTPDCLIRDVLAQEYLIQDNKTDKELKFSNPYQKMKAPLDIYDDCNGNKYRVQLNIYRHIIEKYTDIRIDRLVITHIREDGYEMIPIKRMEVEYLLKHYDYHQKRNKHI